MAAYLFVLTVERPHMRRKYGEAVRGQSGAASALREIIKQEMERVKSHPLLAKVVSPRTDKKNI